MSLWYCTCIFNLYLHVDPFVWNKLQLRLQRESDDSIHDIYDGSEYKKRAKGISIVQIKCLTPLEH